MKDSRKLDRQYITNESKRFSRLIESDIIYNFNRDHCPIIYRLTYKHLEK